MTLVEQISEQVRYLPDDAVLEVLDFIGYLRLKLERRGIGDALDQQSRVETAPVRTWDVKAFLDRFAGSIPDFPDIEDEGPSQEREGME